MEPRRSRGVERRLGMAGALRKPRRRPAGLSAGHPASVICRRRLLHSGSPCLWNCKAWPTGRRGCFPGQSRRMSRSSVFVLSLRTMSRWAWQAQTGCPGTAWATAKGELKFSPRCWVPPCAGGRADHRLYQPGTAVDPGDSPRHDAGTESEPGSDDLIPGPSLAGSARRSRTQRVKALLSGWPAPRGLQERAAIQPSAHRIVHLDTLPDLDRPQAGCRCHGPLAAGRQGGGRVADGQPDQGIRHRVVHPRPEPGLRQGPQPAVAWPGQAAMGCGPSAWRHGLIRRVGGECLETAVALRAQAGWRRGLSEQPGWLEQHEAIQRPACRIVSLGALPRNNVRILGRCTDTRSKDTRSRERSGVRCGEALP